MTTSFARGMARATELTQAGKLDEATALIQSLLANPAAQGDDAPASAASLADPDVIDGTFSRLDGAAADTAAPETKEKEVKDTSKTKAKATSKAKRRKGLRATLAGLVKSGLKMPAMSGLKSPVTVDVPDGAQFLSLSHTGGHGSRDYRLYIPAHHGDGPMPLVVMLHGCTQSPEDFAVGTGMNALAEEFGCLVAYPAQASKANMQKCWNWFQPGDQGRDAGEPALIAGIVGDVVRDHAADPARVYAAGLSAGGAAAAIMGAAYPDVFAAVGVHSGLPVGGAHDMPSAFAAMKAGTPGKLQADAAPTIVFHGVADTTVNPANGVAVVAQSLMARHGLTKTSLTGTSDGGRSYRQTRHDEPDGRSHAEHWQIDGVAHAWSGGHTGGSFTDPAGPDASREMLRFFLQHRRA